MRPDPPPPPIGDGWFESEQPTRHGLVLELRRIALRFRVRPIPVILLAAVLIAGISYKFLRKPRVYEADVVLALTEGTQISGKNGIPFGQLKDYVWTVLMPDAKLFELIEERNLHRLRHKLGAQYALTELRDQINIQIWKNSFIYYDPEDSGSRKSARIGITVVDGDPELAMLLARDLASIIINSHEEQRLLVARALTAQVATMREAITKKLDDLALEISAKQTALAAAQKAHNTAVAVAMLTEIAALSREEKKAEEHLTMIFRSPEAVADQLTLAGLGTRLDLVEERRPDRQEGSFLVLAMILIVVATGALVGSALFLGAFDSRVHDTDDVARLGLPVLGHVPGFPGDDVGSLQSRGARRARVPWFLRWRFQR